jgi:hypothetical protein
MRLGVVAGNARAATNRRSVSIGLQRVVEGS